MALYDPQEFPAETAAISLVEFLAWARTKPAGEPYDYINDEMCAVGQFGRETGRPHLIGLCSKEIDLHCKGLGAAAWTHPWTFGALVERIEAELAK